MLPERLDAKSECAGAVIAPSREQNARRAGRIVRIRCIDTGDWAGRLHIHSSHALRHPRSHLK